MSLSGEILEESIQKFRQQKWGLWKIVLRGKIIGYTGLWRFFNEEQPQLIFALLPDYTKQGYATESARCIVNYAFNVLDYEYLVAALDTENLDSAKVCRNLGMHLSSERKIDGKPTSFFTLKRLDAKTEKH